MSDTLVVNQPTILLLVEEDGTQTTVLTDQEVLILQADGGSGPAGPPGPGGGFRFIYTQSSPAATWVIVHNANAFVNVTLLNSSGVVVDADIVETSLNVTTVMFSTPQTGTAIIT